MKIKELREIGDKLGLKGMADAANEFVENCDGTAESIMELCGNLSVLAKCATCDAYWSEQVCRGEKIAGVVLDLKVNPPS